MVLKGANVLPPPKPMRSDKVVGCNNGKYYEYQQDYGHTTNGCWNLAKVIGKLKDIPTTPPQPPLPPRHTNVIPTGHQARKTGPSKEEVEDILVISGGSVERGEDSS